MSANCAIVSVMILVIGMVFLEQLAFLVPFGP